MYQPVYFITQLNQFAEFEILKFALRFYCIKNGTVILRTVFISENILNSLFLKFSYAEKIGVFMVHVCFVM